MDNSLQVVLKRMLDKFELRARLDNADRTALLGLPFRLQTFETNKDLIREGSSASPY